MFEALFLECYQLVQVIVNLVLILKNFIGGDNYRVQVSNGKFNDLFNQKLDSNNSKKPILQYLFWIARTIIAGNSIYNLVAQNH